MVNIFDSVLIVDSIFAEGEAFVLNSDGSASFGNGGLIISSGGRATFNNANLSLESSSNLNIFSDAGATLTAQILSDDGSATFAGGNVAINSNGNLTLETGASLYVNGPISVDSGAINSDGGGNLAGAGNASFLSGQATFTGGIGGNTVLTILGPSGGNCGFIMAAGSEEWLGLSLADGSGYFGNGFSFVGVAEGFLHFDFGSGGFSVNQGACILGADGSASFLNSQFNITSDGSAAVLGNGMDIVISSTNILSQQSGGWSLNCDGSAYFGGNNAGFTSAGDLSLNNIYVAGAPSATGYLIIHDNEGNPYKVLAAPA